MQNITTSLIFIFQKFRDMTAASPFWLMAFVAFMLRLIVIRPLGALLAITISIAWCWGNMSIVNKFIQNILRRLAMWGNVNEQKSLWYDNVGQKCIMELIFNFSAQGIYCCELTAEISLPPVSHWYAISRELEKQDILTQISGGAFYIAWKPSESAVEPTE